MFSVIFMTALLSLLLFLEPFFFNLLGIGDLLDADIFHFIANLIEGPQLLRFFESELLMHMEPLELVIFQDDFEAALQKDDSLHQKANVKLLIDLLSALGVLLHQLPLDLAAHLNQQFVNEVPDEDEKVKLLRLQLVVPLVFVKAISHVYFVSELSVDVHEEEEDNEEPEQPSDVGEGSVYLGVLPLDVDGEARFFEVYGGEILAELARGDVLAQIVHDSSLGDPLILKGENLLVSGDGVRGHVEVRLPSVEEVEGHIVSILEIVVHFLGAGGVDERVDEEYLQFKVRVVHEVVLESRSRNAGER